MSVIFKRHLFTVAERNDHVVSRAVLNDLFNLIYTYIHSNKTSTAHKIRYTCVNCAEHVLTMNIHECL